jgi:PIN domain nuclease of toxin-antitoxin system
MWELGIKYALGKLPLPVSARDFLAREIETRGYRVLGVERAPNAQRSLRRWMRSTAIRSQACSSLERRSRASRSFSADGHFGAYRELGLALVG